MTIQTRGKPKRVADETLLAFLASYSQKHGYPPSIREIGAGVGLRSTSAVCYRLRLLQENGTLVKRSKGTSRSYALPARMIVT